MKPMNVFVKYISYPLFSRSEGLNGIYTHLKTLEEQQYLPLERLREIQWLKLKDMLDYAYKHTVYYFERFNEFGVHPSDIKAPSDMVKLPILTKKDIIKFKNEMISSQYSKENLLPTESGGTTGLRINFFYGRDSLAFKQAATIRAERWTGWDVGQKSAYLWPARQDYVGFHTLKAKVKNHFYKRLIMCASAMLDDSIIRKHIDVLNSGKPRMIKGFSTPTYLVADSILKNNLRLHFSCNIITTGEPLYDHQREVIQKAFQGKVFDSYGAREVSLIGQECECHEGYHANMECNYIEFLNNGKLSQPGELSDIVVTDLVNKGMPFIRYKMDDQGIPAEEACRCGRNLELFRNIVGRDNDILRSPQGEKVLPRALMLYMINKGPTVGKIQLIQDKSDHVRVLITDHPKPGEDHYKHYATVIKQHFGNDMRVDFEIVHDIPNEKSGKYRFSKYQVVE